MLRLLVQLLMIDSAGNPGGCVAITAIALNLSLPRDQAAGPRA